ncbi:MAG: hypothetical protein QOG62_741 [Thermoleophilaceae bacterium]|nr:hypothetical protein [Thermoleophilaceae bacterium]
MKRLQSAAVRWFSRFIRALGPERLRRTMLGPRRRKLLLGLVFGAMPRAVSRRALAKENVVIGWRITGRSDGRSDMRQLVIESGTAALMEGEPREFDLEISIDGADLMLVATGNASGPALFLKERIELDGDLYLAARLQGIFRIG